LLAEIRALRAAQEEMSRTLREVLTLLRVQTVPPALPAAAPAPKPRGDGEVPTLPGVSARHAPAAVSTLFPPISAPKSEARARQRSVVLIDDDAQSRGAAEAAFAAARLPVRAFGDGNAALAAIAKQKPDVIVVEPALSGMMTGKDVINMIRSTMEWVNIPIVLHSGVPMSREEACTLHGGDDFVAKNAGGQALVDRVMKLCQDA
jgi:CheY-like chemotaxis protein